ncbi:hypothetical protein DVA67_015390 [Solirubrobacter sp. CPCC 204708]|uniref:Uncharacterized protein n=1 Tax=Solirubrobacter deserti TaxID=2282478 RepID=A0ABT4RKK9_9ACTN|nr:hypothetical protein [Solirubrobacter deserti]MBE2317365.1 hypothetical protein [Solirubrobacter deserti]MDA0139094.1 hypothetical protein [Solirubrobacter deserti]
MRTLHGATTARLRVGVVALALALFTAAPAAADGPYEPNETLGAAAGPLPGGTTVLAARETENDVDWYAFYSSGARQLDIQLQVFECSPQPNLSSQSIHFTLRDSRDRIVSEVRDQENGVVSHLRYSTAGRRKFYIVTTPDITRCKYSIRIDPADAVTPESPGHVLGFSGSGTVRASVDGTEIARLTDPAGASVDLGHLVEPQRLTLEVLKSGAESSWTFGLTQDELLVFSDSGTTALGGMGSVVRRLVVAPSGQVVASCAASADEVLDNPVDENCDGQADYRSSVTLVRRGKGFAGRLSSAAAACVTRRGVRLYREGRRPKLLATTRVSRTGQFRFSQGRRSGKRAYVVAPVLVTPAGRCLQVRSPRVRG